MTSLDKRLQTKVKHHHVWAHYLRKWSLDGKNVHYTTFRAKEKTKIKIVCKSVNGVAMEKNFYQVNHLSNEQVIAIRALFSNSSEYMQKLHDSYLNDFLLMQSMELKYQQSGIADDKAEQMFKAWKGNAIENLHTSHESDAQPIVDALAKQDLTILDDSRNMINFMEFIGQQIARTKNFKETILSSQANPLTSIIEGCWWFVSYIFGMNIGAELFFTRKSDVHCLLINNTGTPFITSDQPIINVHKELTDEIKPPSDEQCDFYYPISPTVAYMINKSDRFERGKVEISVDVVEEMNIKMSKRANVHIFSNSDESLKKYLSHIGTNLQAVKDTVA